MSSGRRSALPLFLLVAAASAALGFFAARASRSDHPAAVSGAGSVAAPERKIRFYQSPMHPWITSDAPGRCTICGMALVPVYEGEAGFGDGETVNLSAATAAVIGVETSTIRETDLTRTLRVNGTFETDHTRHRVLSARVPGRIEELFVDQVGIPVQAGQPLAKLYSPALLTAQRVYLERVAVGPSAIAASEVSAARERLLDLGAEPEDIARLERTKELDATVTVRAPFAGTVISRGEKAYAGAYVNEAETLFEIGDLSALWFVFDIYESDLDALAVGQAALISPTGAGSEPLFGHISFIDPNLDPVTRTARGRIVISNTYGKLRHRQTAVAEITVSLGHQMTVPRSAVLFTRREPTVFVALPDQTYLPRPITIGVANGDVYAVTAGLEAGDEVVTRAALLLDGQAQLAAPAAMAPEMPMPDMETMDSGADIAALEPLVLAAADAAAALGNDDLPAYLETLPALHAAWDDYVAKTPHAAEGPLAELVAALVDGDSLDAVRKPFEPFSTQVADLARNAGLHRTGKVNVFQCPMSPVLGVGRWVQRDNELRNPFFGEMMLTCGEKLD